MKPSERATCELIIDTFLGAGYTLNIDDGGDQLALDQNSTDRDAVLNQMGSTSEQWLTLHDAASRQCLGYVYLVFGNEDWVLINDYTANIEHLVEPVCKWCIEQDEKSTRIAVNYRDEFATADMFEEGIDVEKACNLYAGDYWYWLREDGPITLHFWICDDQANVYFKGEKILQPMEQDDE